MAIPNNLPEWDKTQVNIVEVDQQHKDEGWLAPAGVPEKPPFQSFNWWQNLVYQWVLRFKNVTGGLDNITELLSLDEKVNKTTVNVRGYTSINDGGEGTFNYDSTIDKSTANGGTIIDPGETLANQGNGVGNGCWIRQTKVSISVKAFGAKGDGSTDDTDTDAIQACLNYASGKFETIIPAGIYMIDAVTKNINIPSNTTLRFLANASLKAITTSSDSYIVMDIRTVTNVWIYDPTIYGDRTTHTGGTGEQGHCLNISALDAVGGDGKLQTNNINIINPKCHDAWGDGIVVRNGEDITIHNAYAYNNRRNGITINKGINLNFTGTTISSNTNGTAPEAGVDIEPNDALGELINVTFDTLITENNVGAGLSINIGDFPNGGNDKDVSILINSHIDNGSIYGLNMEKCAEGATELITGNIVINSQQYTNNGSNGVYINDYSANNTPHLWLNNLSIINPNDLSLSSTTNGTGINFDRKIGSGLTNNIGNVTIKNPRIVDNRAINKMLRGITGFDNDISGAELENINIIDPIEISGYDAEGDAIQIGWNGINISDKYKTASRVFSGNSTITSRTYSEITHDVGIPVTITDGITVADNKGIPLTIISPNINGIIFDPSIGRAIYPDSTVAGKNMSSTEIGARLTIELRDGNWFILEKIGTWVVEA